MVEKRSDAPEFSYLVRPGELGAAEEVFTLEAAEDERAALARRFGLVAIPAFRAELRLKWVRGRRLLRLRGHIEGEVVQSCVVTLEEVRNRIDERFAILYRPAADGAAAGAGVVDLDAEGDVEPLVGDALDIAEAASEELALALDPYPRKPGASLAAIGPGAGEGAGGGESAPVPGGEDPSDRPFAALAVLKQNG